MLDRYGRNIKYLRLSVTELCNLRCRYCMPEAGICKLSHFDMLTEDEMIAAVEAAAELGISKLRITGGEPLVKRNIISICRRAANVEGIDEVCLTTNGTLLPMMVHELREAGVKRINISLDTLDQKKYSYITRIGNLEEALKGIHSAIDAGFEKIKINSVLIGGFNDDEIRELAYLTLTYPVDLRFIELMPMHDDGEFGESSYISGAYVLSVLPMLQEIGAEPGVAKLYKLPGAKGNVGIISPISNHFCGNCDRIRITADGKVKPCLHSADEYSIKGMSKEEMLDVLKKAILSKPSCHGPLSSQTPSSAGRNMNQIGG